MATTVTTERLIDTGVGGGPRSRNGNGFHQNGSGRAGGDDASIGDRYRIAVWVAVASIVMLFTALVSAYIVRASGEDWRPLAIPRALWLSTTLIALSSITLEFARQALRQQHNAGYVRWLAGTAVLGLGFLGSQLMAWREFVRQGVYISTNPHSSFFYLLTGTHGVHLLGGILALSFLVVRTRKPRATVGGELRRAAAAHATAIYWHFLDGLWICLFLLLFLWK